MVEVIQEEFNEIVLTITKYETLGIERCVQVVNNIEDGVQRKVEYFINKGELP